MGKRLEVLAGPDIGRSFPLGGDTVLIGRSRASEIQLIDSHVSRVHCQVQPEGERFILIDFDSAGGTFVNGKKISRHALMPGDILRIGQTRLQFFDAPDEPANAEIIDAVPVETPAPPRGAAAWARQFVNEKISHFKIGSILGKGNSGYIFHARDTQRNRPIAMKVLDPAIAKDDAAVKRFIDAMKSVLPLKHPNIVRVYGAGKTESNCWVAMEYVPGENLAAIIGRIESAGIPDWRVPLQVGLYLAKALAYAHPQGLIHQNLTPQNVLLGQDVKRTKLLDLMLAAAVERDPTRPINETGEPSDELPYLSPERCDRREIDPRTDIYGIGASMYGLLSGQAPFGGKTAKDVIARIKLEAPKSLRDLPQAPPEALVMIVQRALAKRKEDRHGTAAELYRELASFAKANEVKV